MKIVCLFFLFLPGCLPVCAQFQSASITNSQSSPSVNTYAVVVGISNYKSKGIPKLRFANRDAREFTNFLQSKAGGSVPQDNIRLLVDSAATTAAMYDALTWLLEICKENDIVFFYFSGHGDMENNTIYKLGFLLMHNTPRNNYINNALRIEDLNNVANTLSVQSKVKVVLITDACHSGKLAGSENRGSFLVGEQLRTVHRNEIRITSCAPDELSAENEDWGGGRGVFSYYLVNGLKGLADQEKDGSVTLNELKTFIEISFSKDLILARENHKQNPVIKGNKDFRLAAIDTSILLSAKNEFSTEMVMQASMADQEARDMLSLNAMDYFFNTFKSADPIENIDFTKFLKLSKEEIPPAFLREMAVRSGEFNMNLSKIIELEKIVKEDKEELKRFNKNLIIALHDRVQDVINLYLSGDAAELVRRSYYSNSSYDVYPAMLSVALKLTETNDLLKHILEVNRHYFSSVATRLKIPKVKDPKPLIEQALKELKKAYELEKDAAYIMNELGILYNMKGEYDLAGKYYTRATELSPDWALPWANLAGLSAHMNKLDEGLALAETAKKLQPDFQNTYINIGILQEKKGNLLLGEELYRKSIKMNSRHYFPFERLGNVYMNTTRYALADSFFYEADLRKKGYFFPVHDVLAKPVVDQFDTQATGPCFTDPADLRADGVMDIFSEAIGEYWRQEHDPAELKFKKIIALDKSNPLAFHYLGRLLYEQKRWREADIIFNYAIQYYLDTTAFAQYTDSLSRLLPHSGSRECIIKKFREAYYEKTEDHFFLASLYESWNHFAEAEMIYRKIIELNPSFAGGYYKLWNLLERIGHYRNAEDILRNFMLYDREQGEKDLYAFYKRMIERDPGGAEWYYRAGLFLYQLAVNPDSYTWDKKYIEDDTYEEKFEKRIRIPEKNSGFGVQIPGLEEYIVFAEDIIYPRTEGIILLKKADSLLQSEEALADINYKIGDLYVSQGIPEKASPHYKKSIGLKPDDANTRIKLVETYAVSYFLSDALEQLDSLYQRKEINFDKQLLLAEYSIHAGRFADASRQLQEVKNIHPYAIPTIPELNGRLKLLSGKPKEAIVFYKNYLTLHPDDYNAVYTVSRLYALSGNKKEAWKWLESALKKGFKYSYVLQSDPAWKEYRTAAQWKMVNRFPMQEYEGTGKF